MKNRIFILRFLLLITSGAFAQSELPVDAGTGKITYSETVEAAGVKKDVLYSRATKFATGKYKITGLKKAESILLFIGSFIVNYPGATSGLTDKGTVEFLVKITCKNGAYTYEYTDFRHLGDKGKGNGGKLEAPMSECGKLVLPKAGWDKIKKDTPAGVERFTQVLKKAMG
ncbi:MAG TPA: DUF4468 domain-containing protein [Cytophagaceae bacterium]|jgi:hypothetical protein|nr:DUF4468 domain-containing protein [Cytophagaceae bacterium]